MGVGVAVIMDDWTYSGNPGASANDAVRWLCGDVSSGSALVSDSEITWALSQEGSDNYRAAALVCEAVESQYTQKADKAIGDLKITYSGVADRYGKKAQSLRQRASARGVNVFVGGRSVSRKDTVEDDSDRVTPSFAKGQFDYDTSTSST